MLSTTHVLLVEVSSLCQHEDNYTAWPLRTLSYMVVDVLMLVDMSRCVIFLFVLSHESYVQFSQNFTSLNVLIEPQDCSHLTLHHR